MFYHILGGQRVLVHVGERCEGKKREREKDLTIGSTISLVDIATSELSR